MSLKYQLTTGFSVGQFLLPPGQIIDTSQQAWGYLAGLNPPPDAVALDQITYDTMTSAHGVNGISYPYWMVRYASGITPIHG
jgi:hypothetical protein